MNKVIKILLATLAIGFGVVARGADSTEVSATVMVSIRGFYADGSSVDGAMTLGYAPTESQNAVVKVGDDEIINAGEAGSFSWYAPTAGTYTVSHTVGDDVLSVTYVITNGYAKVEEEPNPPMELVEGITLSPMEIPAAAKGGRSIITISGNGEAWTGATSADWLTLNSTDGTATGKKVICTVAANVSAGSRVGYVYIAGQTITVTQAGREATVDAQVVVDTVGGEVSAAISVTDETTTWDAWTECSWISVLTQSGMGSGEVRLQVAPWNKGASRTGTVTIAGQAVTVTQEAAVVELSKVSAAVCAQGEDVSIDVSAASGVVWSIENVPDWMTLEGEVQRKGTDVVKLTIQPNTTYEERSAVLTIAGKEFTVTQAAAKMAEIEFEGPPVRYLLADGGDLVITVRVDVATAPWSIDISEDAKDDWVFLMDGDEARVGSDTFTLSVWESSDAAELPREATVTLGNQVLTIRQVSEIPDPVPTVAADEELASALEGARDTRLAGNIKDVTKYAKYHAWVDKIAGTGEANFAARQEIKDSGLAWFAYALDLDKLPEKAPTDVVIETIGTSTEGGWDLEVKVGDCEVGKDASAADLGTVFSVEGAAELKEESFSADNVTTTFGAAENGKVKVEVEPKSAAGQFFIRVKMTP